jgi:CubicO group peptidase (beta-lactamase class C family)
MYGMAIAPQARLTLPQADPASEGVDPERLDRLYAVIESHIAEGRYPGAQVALARRGKLLAGRSFGQARLAPHARPASDDSLWLLYSQTKVVTAAAIWVLVEQGALTFNDRIADHVPEFAANSKGEITLHQVLTHQAGFPKARPGAEVWDDHALLRKVVCDFELEWWPGSRVQYHGASAHWTCAVLIEAVTGRDYRDFIRSAVLDPLGLADIFVGVPAHQQDRCVDMYVTRDGRFVGRGSEPDAPPAERENDAAFRAAGIPGGGGYATAAAMQAFYQMLAAGGTLNGTRLFSPRLIQWVTRNQTGDRVDENFGIPMHRGLGPHVRGTTPAIRGLGTIASPSTFGHGGADTSYSWADPDSGLSFTYLTNGRVGDPWHSRRLDQVSSLAHAALVEP